MSEKFLFRIRQNENIVGYKKYMSARLYFFSKDLYGFSSKEIDYNQQDQFSGFFNKDGSHIFENDILKSLNDDIYIICSSSIDINLIYLKYNNKGFNQITSEEFSKLSKNLNHFSYLFINNDLKEKINSIQFNYDI